MQKFFKMLNEFGMGGMDLGPDAVEGRRRADMEFLSDLPVADLVVSNADKNLIADQMNGALDEVLCALLMQVLKMKPMFEREGATSAALMLILHRLNGVIDMMEDVNVSMLATYATNASIAKGMSSADIRREAAGIIGAQLDKLFGEPPRSTATGIPEDGGKAEDEQIRKDLGR